MIIVRNLAKNLECFYDFFKRKNSHEIYKKIMYILLNSTVIAFILLLIVKLIFDFLFRLYSYFFRFVFLLGLIIGSIPDFIEKKG